MKLIIKIEESYSCFYYKRTLIRIFELPNIISGHIIYIEPPVAFNKIVLYYS